MTEWEHRLVMADSQNRAGVLVAALRDTPDPAEKAKLLAGNFNICDALAPWRDELREQMELSDFFTDADDGETIKVPKFPRYVYRGAWEDDEAELALSWTTSQKQAEWFASYLTSIRAAFLGIRREGVTPVVFRARCHEAFGYLNGRGEQEVVAKRLTSVTPILALQEVPA
jgi:hypothetical protein